MAMKEVSVVLAHGAWAEGSSWAGVIAALKKESVEVSAAPLPLTSLADDVAALNRSLDRTEGPIVLAGHAYAGAVIALASSRLRDDHSVVFGNQKPARNVIPVEGEPADVVAIVTAYDEWLAKSRVPKLFLKAEPGGILSNDADLEFVRKLPAQTEVTVAGVHYVQEDSPHEIGQAIAGWIGTLG